MKLDEAPIATILEQLRKGAMDASLFNWTYGGGNWDPDDGGTLHTDGASNFSHYSNAKVDELIAAGLRATTVEDRAAAYKEIQAIVADEVPFIFMMYWNWYNLFAKRIKGLPETAKDGSTIYLQSYKFWIDES
jgi:peptide/nickel transport system substrate-binding protein